MGSPKKDWYRAARASGHYPLTFNFIFIRQDKHVQCSYCGKFIHEKKLTRDHVWPKSKGGLIKTPSCLSCNIAKEDMTPIQWAVHSSITGLAFADSMYEEDQSVIDVNGSMSVFQTESAGSNPAWHTKELVKA